MPNIAVNEGFNYLGLEANIIATAVLKAKLKGENYIELSEFTDLGISKDQIAEACEKLLTKNVFAGANMVPLDDIAGISVGQLTLGVTFNPNNQPSLKFEAPPARENQDEFRIGSAIYRALLKPQIVDDVPTGQTLIDISRLTVDELAIYVEPRFLEVVEVLPSLLCGWELLILDHVPATTDHVGVSILGSAIDGKP